MANKIKSNSNFKTQDNINVICIYLFHGCDKITNKDKTMLNGWVKGTCFREMEILRNENTQEKGTWKEKKFENASLNEH